MIELTFLGTGSAIPSLKRNHAGIILEYSTDERKVLLFDCGEGTQKQFMKSDVSFMKLDKIFITHWHADHFAGLIPLIQTMNLEGRETTLKIFGPEAEKFVSNIVDLGYFGLRFPVEAFNVPYAGEEPTLIDETEEYEIYSTPVHHTVPSVAYLFKEKDSWSIDLEKLKAKGLKRGKWLKDLKKNLRAEHKGKDVRIEDIANPKPGLKVVYSGDTVPCENLMKLSKDVNLLIHDSTFLEGDTSRGHSSSKQAAEIAKEANVGKLILTHISRRYVSKDDLKTLLDDAKVTFPKTVLSKDLMKIRLKKE